MRASRYELPYQGLWAGAGVKQPQANGYRGEPGAAPGAGVILAQAPAVLTSDRIEVPFAGYRDPSGARRLQSAVPEALQSSANRFSRRQCWRWRFPGLFRGGSGSSGRGG